MRKKLRNRLIVWVAILVVIGLVALLRPGPEDRFISQLKSKDVQKRLAAIDGLKSIGSNRAWDAIATQTDDANVQVATHAIHALGGVFRKSTVAVIAKGLEDSRAAIRQASLVSLARCSRRLVRPTLIVDLLAKETEPNVRAAGFQAAGGLIIWDAMPILVASLRDENRWVRLQAAKAIQKILGVNHGFNADDPVDKREKVIKSIEAQWPSFKDAVEGFLKRLEAK